MGCYKSIFRNLPFPCLLFEKKKNLYVIKEANSLYLEVTNKSEKELMGKTSAF